MSSIIGLIHMGLAISKVWPQMILLSLLLASTKLNVASYAGCGINLEFYLGNISQD